MIHFVLIFRACNPRRCNFDQQRLIVRLVTRYHLKGVTTALEKALMNFIIEDQRQRTDLPLLWLAELFAQIMGFSYCIVSGIEQLTEIQRMQRYDECMCLLLNNKKSEKI
jgi:hypothetical protein